MVLDVTLFNRSGNKILGVTGQHDRAPALPTRRPAPDPAPALAKEPLQLGRIWNGFHLQARSYPHLHVR
jgi:hypothetical protein